MHHKSTIKIDMEKAQMRYCVFEALSERGGVFQSIIDTDKIQTYRKPGVWYHSSVEIVGGFWDSFLPQPPEAEAPSKDSTLLFSIAHAVLLYFTLVYVTDILCGFSGDCLCKTKL